MRSFLIRCYPARWRARYGDEFEAILDERPIGPFDVADILLAAVDAHLRLRGQRSDVQPGRGMSMSLRIGGLAAIIGGGLFASSIILGIGIGDVDPVIPGILLVTGSLALLVALTGMSAFQARVHPVLSWIAFGVTAGGTIVAFLVALAGMQLFYVEAWYPFILGILCALVGSTLFAIATYQTAALSRGAALLLGVCSVSTIVGGFAGNVLGPVPLIVAAIGFAVAWIGLGTYAVRVDRPAGALRQV